MSEKATPRRLSGTRHDSIADHTALIAIIVPRAHLAPDYTVLAAMLHYPDLAAPYAPHLHPGDWTTDLHQIMARMGLSHLRAFGRVDHRQLCRVLHVAGTVRPKALTLDLATLVRVAELIVADEIVADAVAVLTAHRRGAVR